MLKGDVTNKIFLPMIDVLNWCHFIDFWCHFINFCGHALLIAFSLIGGKIIKFRGISLTFLGVIIFHTLLILWRFDRCDPG